MSDMKTTFSDAACPTPGAAGDHQGTSGGFDLPGGAKETPGTTMPQLPTTTTVEGAGGPGNVGGGETIENFKGTIHPAKG